MFWSVIAMANPEPPPEWAELRVTELAAAAPEERLDLVSSWVEAEPLAERRAALVAVARLLTDPIPDLAAYARAMLTARTAGERSYIAAAAGLGGAVDEHGAPTMSVEEARALYAARRGSVGGVEWTLCWHDDVDPRAFATGGLPAEWQARPMDEDTKLFVGLRTLRDRTCLAAVGWTVFLGDRPVSEARDLPPEMDLPPTCAMMEVVLGRSQGGISRGFATADPRPQDCVALDEGRMALAPYNSALAAELHLTASDVVDVRRAPGPQLKPCAAPKAPPIVDVCTAISAP